MLAEVQDVRDGAGRRIATPGGGVGGGRAFLFARFLGTGSVLRDGPYKVVETERSTILCHMKNDRLGRALGQVALEPPSMQSRNCKNKQKQKRRARVMAR